LISLEERDICRRISDEVFRRYFNISTVAWWGGGAILTNLTNLGIAMVQELNELKTPN
jgi:hypothetical protein